MSAKKPRAAKKATVKKPAKKQRIEAAEQAVQKALDAKYFGTVPEVSPLELAHLVVAMGLGDQADGPAKALMLVARSATCITAMRRQIEQLNDNMAKGNANDAMLLAKMGLSPEKADGTFSVDQVIARLPTAPLKIGDETLRGKHLWDEFRRQVDPQSERPGKEREDGTYPEEYTLIDLIRFYKEFKVWRNKIAAENVAKGSKNLPKVNRERKKSTLTDGAEAVDAAPLPKKD
jgi:hypothetical protein